MSSGAVGPRSASRIADFKGCVMLLLLLFSFEKPSTFCRRSVHLESCTPERKLSNWNVLVCTGTYQSVPVPASTRIPTLIQAGTRWSIAVPDFLVWNKTVPASTRFPQLVQDSTRQYQQEFFNGSSGECFVGWKTIDINQTISRT